jgi:hypothetical protein
MMHIGIDLDNTLIDYGKVFALVGLDLGVLPLGMEQASKLEVRDFLRESEVHGNDAWMRVQGQVYGRYLERASLMPGVEQALLYLRRMGAHVSIVSHKTKFGHFDAHKINLQEAALQWLQRRKFFSASGFSLSPEDIHFLETRNEKISRIGEIGCSVFIDDLPEVLMHSNLPANVRRIWFAEGGIDTHHGLEAYTCWDDILTHVLANLFQGQGHDV